MPKSVQLLICPEAEADLYAYRRARDGAVVRIIRGQRCCVIDRCMGEWAAALQFPYCFEPTWESFRQSLRDSRLAPGKSLLLIITNSNRLLPRAKADFVQLLQSLDQYSTMPSAPATLEIVLHSQSRDAEEVQSRLVSAAIEFSTMDASERLK